MADGLTGLYKDFEAGKSFDDLADFFIHLNGKGEVDVTGHLRCSQCGKNLSDYKGPAVVSPKNGQGNVVCTTCEDAIYARVEARRRTA